MDLQKGSRFGYLTTLGERERRNGKVYEKCLCDCGNEKRVYNHHLATGKTRSCGCFQRENASRYMTTHGMRKTRIYKIYTMAKQRCENPADEAYYQYGGRGIKFLWDSFEEFYNDMGEFYKNHVAKFGENDTTIERIDNNGNYCKENCRWATNKEQSNNRSNNRIIEYMGEKLTLTQWADKIGISVSAITGKLKRGVPMERIVKQPHKRRYSYYNIEEQLEKYL